MPNRPNVDAPVILLGPGRSGSSLIMSLFGHHPECSTVGETANVIFGTWQGLIDSEGGIPPLVEHDRAVPHDARAGRAVRKVFLACFPDDKRFWMQKPIGVPQALLRFDDPGSAEAGQWFWRAMRASFPRARYLVALRHPCDVVLSSRDKWGFDDEAIWRTQANLAGLILHPDAPVIHAVHYETLVRDREAAVRRMFDAAEVPFDHAVMQAFDTVHVPARGRERPSESGFTRKQKWDGLDPATLSAEYRQSIAALYDTFGVPIEWPARFTSQSATAGAREELSAVEQLEVRIGELNRRIELMHLDHADEVQRLQEAHARKWHDLERDSEARWDEHQRAVQAEWSARDQAARAEWDARDREAARVFDEQKAWIEELERAKAWLQSQVDSWRAVAERRAATPGDPKP